MGEDSTARSGTKQRFLLNEAIISVGAIYVRDEQTCRAVGGDGELPLFFATSPESQSPVIKQAEAGSRWPMRRPEIIGSWARSFRRSNEFDNQDPESSESQHILPGRGRPPKLAASGSSPGGGSSFRFLRSDVVASRSEELFLLSGSREGRSISKLSGQELESGTPGSSSIGDGRVKFPENDRVVPASMRSEVLRRLRDLKAHPSSPMITPQDELVDFQSVDEVEVADVRRRLKPSSRKNEGSSSKSAGQRECNPVLSELEDTEITERTGRQPAGSCPANTHSCSSPGKSSSAQSRASQNLQQSTWNSTRRFRDHGASPLQDKIVDIRKQSHIVWEEELPAAKTIAAAVDRALARRLSRDGNESRMSDAKSSPDFSLNDRTSSHRYYSGALSRERSFKHPSERRSSAPEKETLLDLNTPAAAKFLVGSFDKSPCANRRSCSSSSSASSPTFLVPFKWEDAPGKAKQETAAIKNLRSTSLQLPPRLAAARPEGVSTSRRHSRVSSSCTNFLMPCLASASSTPVIAQKADPKQHLIHTPSKSSRKPAMIVALHSHSTLKEGCRDAASKPVDSNHASSKKASIDPTRLTPVVSEVKLCKPSSPTSILWGPTSSSQTSWSSTAMFSSGDLEDFAPQGTRFAAVSEPVSEPVSELVSEPVSEVGPILLAEEEDAELLLAKKAGAPTSSDNPNGEGEEPQITKSPKTSPTVQAEKVDLGSEAAADVNCKDAGNKPSPSRPRRRRRLLISIFKSLKHALSRKKPRRRKCQPQSKSML